jgi:serine/threonine protein kinase
MSSSKKSKKRNSTAAASVVVVEDTDAGLIKQVGNVTKLFRMGKKIASGLQGTVYHATELKTGYACALKLQHFSDDLNPVKRNQMLRMIAFEPHCHDEIICERTNFFCHYKGHTFFAEVMEYVRAPTLRELLFQNVERGTAPPLSMIQAIMQHLCSALTLMHAQHVVHHDIHDGNIMWDSTTRTFRLIDLDSVADVDPTHQRSKRAKALAQDMIHVDVWDVVKMYKEMVYWTCLPKAVYAAYPSEDDEDEVDLDRVVLEAPASSLTAASWKKIQKTTLPPEVRAMQAYLGEVEAEHEGPQASFESAAPISLERISSIFGKSQTPVVVSSKRKHATK